MEQPRSVKQSTWYHKNKQFRFRTPEGVEYVDRRARSGRDEVLEEVTPPIPAANDLGVRLGDQFKLKDLGGATVVVTDYDETSNLIKVHCSTANGTLVNCLCIHGWEEQFLYMDKKYRYVAAKARR
jgi:hypothetical protein